MIIDKNKCPQNHRCPAIKVCPTEAIKQKNHALPTIDADLCILCKKCVEYCPMEAIRDSG